MAVSRGVVTFVDNFDRAQTLTTTPGHNGWTIKDTSSAGTPTYLTTGENGGAMKLTFDSQSEAQIITMYQNDILFLDLAKLQRVWFTLKVAGIDNVTDLVCGVSAAQNDTEDSIVTNAWFKIDGSVSTSIIVAESDDGTNDNDDIATGETLAAVYKKCVVDFTNGLKDVRYTMDGARVAGTTTFDMSDLTAGLNVQPFVQIHKASGTGVGSVTIAQYGHQYSYAYGA